MAHIELCIGFFNKNILVLFFFHNCHSVEYQRFIITITQIMCHTHIQLSITTFLLRLEIEPQTRHVDSLRSLQYVLGTAAGLGCLRRSHRNWPFSTGT